MNDPENNRVRLGWCWFYLVAGILLLVVFWVVKTPPVLKFLIDHSAEILWCLGWGGIGIALGLYNSRQDKDKKGRLSSHAHYCTYFVFVWFVAALSAFVALENLEKSIVGSYASATLVGMLVGFVGDKLAGKLFEIVPYNN